MLKSATLPFRIPLFATTNFSAGAELAMIGHPTAYNQVLNQCTNFHCKKDFLHGFTTPQVDILSAGIHRYGIIERYSVNLRYAHKYCLEFIKAMIDDEMYVYYSFVDDFYLPGKSWYGTRHMHHDGIICGYDDNDETVSIAAYDVNWVYRLIRVPQKSFLEGVQSSLCAKQYGSLTAYKIKDNTDVELDESKILEGLKEYVDSNFDRYPATGYGYVLGVVVHDYLAKYIDKLKDGSIPYEKMDWRALRPVWEHKKCMLERIQAVENKNGWSNELSERYAPVVEKANRIRMMYAVYHKNHNNKLLDKIRDGLLELAESDKVLVGEFISKLEALTK